MPLEVQLETPPPTRLAVGRGTALFLRGRCAHPAGPIRELHVLAGEAEHPVMAHGIPTRALGRPDCWWAIVPFPALGGPATVPLRLRAVLSGGAAAVGDIGAVRLEPAPERRAEGPGRAAPAEPVTAGNGAGAVDASERPLIAICMATFEPPPDLFQRQIASIRAQTYDNWVCVISDDASGPASLAAMEEVLAGDPRFLLVRAPDRRGFYGNFERALALAPPEARYIALADQDDRWYPEKLDVLLRSLAPGAKLVYSDMRVTARDGEVLSPTYWSYRRNNHTDFGSLLVSNTVTGSAALFDREVLDFALPFPPPQGEAYHDHWIAVVAMALGELSYVDRPLHDYVQHATAVLGHARANGGRGRGRSELSDRGLRALSLVRRAIRPTPRTRYFDAYCRVALVSRILRLRCADAMDAHKRGALARFTSHEDSAPVVRWLASRLLRGLLGAERTLGNERSLLVGIAWRRLAGWLARVRARAPAPRPVGHRR